jgi:hypothetical protein
MKLMTIEPATYNEMINPPLDINGHCPWCWNVVGYTGSMSYLEFHESDCELEIWRQKVMLRLKLMGIDYTYKSEPIQNEHATCSPNFPCSTGCTAGIRNDNGTAS